jgi:hypothetical protein
MILLKKTCLTAVAVFISFSLAACRSPYVQTSVVNQSGATASLIEVDYPSASFGTQQIANEAAYHYHFKIQDSGPVKITFTEAGNKTYTATGPTLTQGQQGSLTITLEGSGKVSWNPQLSDQK